MAGFKKKATTRGMVKSLVVVVIIPTFFLSVLLYRTFYMRYYDLTLSTNKAILDAISVSVEDNRKLVENVIQLMSYDKTVTSCLKSQEGAYSEQILQVFKIQELIAQREAILSRLGGDIVIFSDRESVLVSYWYLLHTASAMEMEGYQQFMSTGKISGWTGEEYMYPKSTMVSDYNRQTMLSYYRLITDSISGRLGVIKCGVQKNRFLEAVSTAEIDGKLFVTQGNQIIYGENPRQDTWDVSFDGDKTSYDIDGVLYITHPIPALDMKLIVALDKRTMVWQAVVYALPQLLMVLGTAAAMLTAGRKFACSIYKRIDQIVDVAKSAKSNYMDVTLPNSDDDDINALVDALNVLIQQIRSHANSLIEHEKKEKSAQRLAFQYQMNPHFLFNTLNWMQMCIELGTELEKISEGIVILGRLLRYNLNGEAFAPVCQEIESTQDYIRLMNMRKKDAISLDIELSDVDPGQRLMRFMLQPLCENAIQHGLSPNRHLHIKVHISKAGNEFMVAVKNDGIMIEPQVAEEIMDRIKKGQGGGGVGLVNIYSRIKLLYGEDSDLIIESEKEETSIILKLKEGEGLMIT